MLILKITPLLTLLYNGLILQSHSMAVPVSDAVPSHYRTITVGGDAIQQVVPDKATVRFAVSSRHKDPEDARRLNAETSKQAMNAVRDLNIEERKIKMQSLRINPVQEYNQKRKRYEEVGYEAQRELTVEIEDLDTLPSLVAKVVQSGANRLQGVEYGLKDKEAPRNQALVEAIEKARTKAQLIASTLNVELGNALQVTEQSSSMPMHHREHAVAMTSRAASMAAPEPEAYAAGEMEIKATIQVVFELK